MCVTYLVMTVFPLTSSRVPLCCSRDGTDLHLFCLLCVYRVLSWFDCSAFYKDILTLTHPDILSE